MAEELPLVLSDGTNSYIYGPGGLPIEQINNSTGTTTYLHHDQQGSTRLLTGSTGTVTGKCTYGAYGAPTCEGSATTPLGYDGQYTSSDTGLIYLQARVYDPTTAQFLTVDPAVSLTLAPYVYGGDNPVNYMDRAGLAEESIGEGSSCPPGLCFPFPNGKETERGLEAAKELPHEIGHAVGEVGHGAENIWNEVTGNGASKPSGNEGKPYDEEEDALIKIAKGSQKTGLTPEEAETLREWAEELEMPFRGPESHDKGRTRGKPHYHCGTVGHIPALP
jgi:RHS repeat-associated protein